MKERFLLLACLLVLASTCEGQLRPPYPDNSLDVSEYGAMGVPAPDGVWVGKDYIKGLKTLQQISGINKFALPRKNSAWSAQLFDRLVALENVEAMIDPEKAIPERLKLTDSLANAFNDLINLYMEPNERQERFGAEVIAIQLFRTQLTKMMLLQLNELKEAVGKRADTTQFQEMEEGQKTFHLQSVKNLIAIVEDATLRYPSVAKRDLLKVLNTSLDDFISDLAGPVQAQLKKQMEYLNQPEAN